ncbi:MAG: tyrosine-type recombinase/integrase [Armatimonadota bacterium]
MRERRRILVPRSDWERLVRCAGEERDEPRLAFRDRAVVATFLFSGLRCGELTGLDLDDVEWTETPAGLRCRLRLRKPGSGPRRRAALAALGAELLEEYLDLRPEWECPALFLSRKGGRLDRSAVWRVVHRAGARAGYPELRPGDLRRAFAAEAVRQAARKGNSLEDVARQLGHELPESTRRCVRR